MAYYVHLFETNNNFQSDYHGSGYTEPWTSYNLERHSLNYNKTEYERLHEVPLTFEITSGGTIVWKAQNTAYTCTIEYKKNDGAWTSITSATGSSAPSISVVSGDTVQFRGNNAQYATAPSIYNGFSGTTCGFKVKGNIMSLVNSTGFSVETILQSAFTFTSLLRNCTGLTDASKLVLPATTLTESCYRYMLGNTKITQAPKLPATVLATSCYLNMFRSCTSLTIAPELPATTLADSCYVAMFMDCTSLTIVHELPSTTLAYDCYESMFYGCTSLITAPSSIGNSATIMPASACCGMFYNCTSLTTVPELPATTLGDSCYLAMFQYCTNLTTAPELPATTLANSCYNLMFRDCTGLTTAPELPATTLVDGCYYYMFYDCTNLNYIKCLATDISASDCTGNWVKGVQTNSGTFIKVDNFTGWATGVDGIPENWNIRDVNIN